MKNGETFSRKVDRWGVSIFIAWIILSFAYLIYDSVTGRHSGGYAPESEIEFIRETN